MLNIKFNEIETENPDGVLAEIYVEINEKYSFLRNSKVKILDEAMKRCDGIKVYVNSDWMVDHISIHRYTDMLKWHIVTLEG